MGAKRERGFSPKGNNNLPSFIQRERAKQHPSDVIWRKEEVNDFSLLPVVCQVTTKTKRERREVCVCLAGRSREREREEPKSNGGGVNVLVSELEKFRPRDT